MLTPEIIKQVKQIQIRTGRQVADVLAGEYLSVFKGVGMEFDEVRPYVPGDDIRTIDWNVTARTGTPFVKRFVEQRELTVVLLVDISPSLHFGSGARSKREAATELSALLAFSAIENNDNIGLLLFDSSVDCFIPPRKGQKHALRIIRELLARSKEYQIGAGLAPEPTMWRKLTKRVAAAFSRLKERSKTQDRKTNIAEALQFCRQILHRRAVIFLISDFVDEGYIEALRSVHRKHDLISVIVSDEREFDVKDAGIITLQDPESGAIREVDTASAEFREQAAKSAQDRIDKIRDQLNASGCDLIQIDATKPVIDPLLRFFKQRQRRYR
ncbi:MAG: DUF58 domain-containing protein [Bradymonadales bacterium]